MIDIIKRPIIDILRIPLIHILKIPIIDIKLFNIINNISNKLYFFFKLLHC